MVNQNKAKILSEFEMMKDFELTAKELYIKIAGSADVKQQEKETFTKMAEDEQRHADIVQKIINITTNAL
jgi:rubrerythrin